MHRILLSLLAPALGCLALASTAAADSERLEAVLAAQPAEAKARYQYRNPAETLAFFGVEPGMTVVDTLPGRVWYTGILLDYLGPDGKVIGADYGVDTWKGVGYDSAEFLETRKNWADKFINRAAEWRNDDSAAVGAFVFGELPDSMHGSADVVLFVRALHNMAYTAPDDANLKAAIRDAYDVLKPGGVVGVVQHHARDDMSDAWASGENGYLKQGYVVELMEAAGFEYAGSSDVNANDKDRPTESDFVWRLPPSLSGSDDDAAKRAAMQAIGESNRMTLKFVKR